MDKYSFKKDDILLFLLVLLSGLVVHGQELCNMSLSIDDAIPFINIEEQLALFLMTERWGVYLFKLLFALPSVMPFVNVFFAVVFLSLSAFAVARFLNVRDTVGKLVLGVLFVAFPQYAYMMQYALQADVNAFAIFLSICMCIFYERFREEKRFLNLLFALLCCLFSVSIYQAVIFVPFTLFSLYYVKKTLDGDDSSLKRILLDWAGLGFIVICSFLLYKVISREIVSYALNVSDSTNSGKTYFDEFFRWNKDALSLCLERVQWSIKAHLTGKFFVGESLFAFIWIPVTFVLWQIVVSKNTLARKGLGGFFLIVSILAPFTQILIMGSNQPPRVHLGQSLLFSGVWLLALPFLLKIRIKPVWIYVCLFLFVCKSSYLVTSLYVRDMWAEKMEYSMASAMDARIRSLPGYIEGKTPVALLGAFERDIQWNNPYICGKDIADRCDTFGYRLFRFDHLNQKYSFFLAHCIADYVIPSKNLVQGAENEIGAMPEWPASGSVQMINGVVYVKLSSRYSTEIFPDITRKYASQGSMSYLWKNDSSVFLHNVDRKDFVSRLSSCADIVKIEPQDLSVAQHSNCVLEEMDGGVVVTAQNPNPMLVLAEESPRSVRSVYIFIRCQSNKEANFKIYYSSKRMPFSEEKAISCNIHPGENYLVGKIKISRNKIFSLRLDPSDKEDVKVVFLSCQDANS